MNNVSIIGKGPLAHGTKVFVDGVQMRGVTKVELVAGTNCAWRCVIHVIPAEIDVSDLDSTCCEFVDSGKAKAA